MSNRKKLILALLVLGLAGYLATGLHKIRPGEGAVVRRFGKVLDVQPRPGLWIGLPWGMDRVDKVAVDQVRQVTVGYQEESDDGSGFTPPGQLITGDQNLVNVRIVVSYAVDPEKLVQYVLQRDQCEQAISLVVESTLAEWIGSRPIAHLLAEGKSSLPQAILEQSRPRLERLRLGVQLRGISVVFMVPPKEVKEAFDSVNAASASMQAKINLARQQARVEEARADQLTYRWREEAKADAHEIEALARADAAVFRKRLRDYQANPSVLTTGRWETLRLLLKQLRETGDVRPIDPAMTSGSVLQKLSEAVGAPDR